MLGLSAAPGGGRATGAWLNSLGCRSGRGPGSHWPTFAPPLTSALITDVLIERASFLASLEGLLGETAEGSGWLVFLGGEAGVGKTTLATALAEAAQGPMIRRGGCDSVTTAEPLGPSWMPRRSKSTGEELMS